MSELLLPSNKITRINLQYILENYLDPEFWKFKWKIFEYDGYIFTLSIRNIDIKANEVDLIIQSNTSYWDYATVTIPLGRRLEEIEGVFKKTLVRNCLRLIRGIEHTKITKTDSYLRACELDEGREEEVAEQAKKLLDSLNIKHEGIRDAYIEDQVSNNESGFARSVLLDYENKLITDVYRAFLLLFEEEERLSDFEVDGEVQAKIDEHLENVEFEEIELEDIE